MALPLVEANKYSNTTLEGWVVDRLWKSSEILQRLPFETLNGNSLTYNTKTTMSTANFHSVNEVWNSDEPVLTQSTATITILGDDANIDNFIKQTRSNIIDVQRTVLEDKIQAIKNAFTDAFFYGSGTAPAFTGLQSLISDTTYNTVHAGAGTGSVLSMAKLYQALDLPFGRPDVLVMTKTMRRGIQIYLDSVGDKFPSGRDTYGNMIETFQGVPVIVDDNLLNTETAASGAYTAKTGGACTTIFGLKFGAQDVCGLQSGQITTKVFEDLESMDATRIRIKWYCGLMMANLRTSFKVDGITAAGTVTA